MYNKKRIALVMTMAVISMGVTGCGSNETNEQETKKIETSVANSTESNKDTNIFDGKKATRSFMISEVLHKTEGNYIETYEFRKENNKNILYLKGDFRIIGTMDGEVGIATEAKLEIADGCVFNDNRSEYSDKIGINLEAFQKHINGEDFQKPMSISITVDNGQVWLVEIAN